MADTKEVFEESEGQSADSDSDETESGFIAQLCTSPINLALLALCFFLLYKIIKGRRPDSADGDPKPLPPLKKRDFSLDQLKEFDGRGPEGRILIAVNGNVFDVTKAKETYGPNGPYGLFAGRDASRGLGTFSLKEEVMRDSYDDLSDLTSKEMDKIHEWEKQFQEKYQLVGRLLRDGEEPNDYSDTEEEHVSPDRSKHD